jgi:hypothetical protein
MLTIRDYIESFLFALIATFFCILGAALVSAPFLAALFYLVPKL